MDIVIALTAAISISFLILRSASLKAGETPPSGAMLMVLGLASWVFILSMAAWFLITLFLLFALVAGLMPGAVLSLIWIALISGMAVRINESLDTATVFHYLRESAMFRPMKHSSVLLQEELDKKKIRDVHRETSGMPFPTIGTKKRLLTAQEIDQIRKEAVATPGRPVRSGRFEDEVRNLRTGTPASLSDPWKLYTFDHQLHDLYTEMSNIVIDPTRRMLHFRLNTPGASRQALDNPVFVYQWKQELYQLLQVPNTDPWLAWYNDFFDRIAILCFGIEPDSFGHTQMFPFFRIEIARKELSSRDGMFFNAADLHTIATIIFNNGEPLQDDAL